MRKLVASLEGMDAGAELGKYRVEARLGSNERAYFSAASKDGGVAVCLVELQGDEVETYSAAAKRKTEHAHLAQVLEVFSHDGVPLLVFEHVPGTTLTELLAEIGKKSEVEAVGAALRVSDALSTLHDAGGVHGFIHTDSVIVEPPERLSPVLTFAPIPSDERTFHSPERGETGKPSVADDSWAAAGLLFMMLTGSAPPKAGYTSVEELGAAGVEHPALREALLHGLNANPEVRSKDIRPLKRELARWFVEHAGEEAVLLGPHSTMPPPLPAGFKGLSRQPEPVAVVAAARPVVAPRRPRFAVLAVVGTLVGLLGAWAISALRPKPPPEVAEATPTQAAPPESAKAIDLSEVPVTGEEQKQAIELDKVSSCVANYLPKGAFGKSPDLTWMCTESDPNKGAQSLRVAIVGSAPKGTLTDAMKLAARLGWYDMAAFAVVRAGCCEDPKPLATPEPGKGCDSVADSLHEIAKAVIAGRSYDEPFKKYTGAIHCELNQGKAPVLGRTQRPQPGEDSAFKEFVDAIAH
jgi:serine/threonine protein kinase